MPVCIQHFWDEVRKYSTYQTNDAAYQERNKNTPNGTAPSNTDVMIHLQNSYKLYATENEGIYEWIIYMYIKHCITILEWLY